MGSILALMAFLSWGLGDFLIQKTTRKFGNWLSLFYITASATIILLPLIYKEIPALFFGQGLVKLEILFLAGVVSTMAALFFFEGLRRGKIAIVEPIYAFEIAITAALANWFLHEKIGQWQFFLITILIIGIVLVSVKSWASFKNFKLEAGVIFAILATIAMGTENFLYGLGARQTSPLLINWFTSAFITVVTLIFILYQGDGRRIITDFKKQPALILWLSLFDNLGWIAYSYSMLYIPLALATGISEGYIALAVSLGFIVNQERIKIHQVVGLSLALAAAMALAWTVNF